VAQQNHGPDGKGNAENGLLLGHESATRESKEKWKTALLLGF
jgi:hypothetical protein